ncbi:chorismate mutase [Streptoalloteichus hindustanus]|uniref:Chorismate mutase n=1 Tax=Streptoalloteichus hindustanus TaxID=2017 RepID=A0A1M5H1D7_STRHI|nr:chorismate mutase [Streptoalloteichus hindustanus]SHG09809.1 chorismate mutase [Streptoalloteichus hindustanus]
MRLPSRLVALVFTALALAVIPACAPPRESATTAPLSTSAPARQRPSADAEISEHRHHIDHLDAEIAQLLRERRDVSRRIQQRRIETGGGRVDPGREERVIARYREALGPEGEHLARALLDTMRGTSADREQKTGK